MAKGKAIVYFCQNCGYESGKWMGRCPGCKEWNTFVEEVIDKKSVSSAGKVAVHKAAEPTPISAITAMDEKRETTKLGSVGIFGSGADACRDRTVCGCAGYDRAYRTHPAAGV